MSVENSENGPTTDATGLPSSPSVPSKPKRITTASQYRKRSKFFLVNVGALADPIYFKCKRLDLVTMALEGIIPAQLTGAIDRLQDFRREMAIGSPAKAVESLKPEDKAGFKEVIRRAAVAATVEPRLTLSKEAAQRDENLLWVGGVSDIPSEIAVMHAPIDEDGDVDFGTLNDIWRAIIGEAKVEFLTDSDAEEFRPTQ